MKTDTANKILHGKNALYACLQLLLVVVLILLAACQGDGKQRNAGRQPADSLPDTTFRQPSGNSTARPVFPGGDALQQNCEQLRAQAESLLDEYFRKGTQTERLKQITTELEHLEEEWNQMDCRQVFGHIIPEIPLGEGKEK